MLIKKYDYPYKSAGIVRFIGHLLWYNRHEQSEKGMKVHVETEMQADQHQNTYGTICNRGALPGVPGQSPVAGRLRMSKVRRQTLLQTVKRALSVLRLPSSDFCDRWNVHAPQPCPSDKMVSCTVSCYSR